MLLMKCHVCELYCSSEDSIKADIALKETDKCHNQSRCHVNLAPALFLDAAALEVFRDEGVGGLGGGWLLLSPVTEGVSLRIQRLITNCCITTLHLHGQTRTHQL